MGIKNILERNPIIPAIKDNITLEKALNSNSELVFIILSNIINIKDYTDKLKKANKKVYIHIDMIDGLNSTNNGIDYIVNTVRRPPGWSGADPHRRRPGAPGGHRWCRVYIKHL